MSLAGSLALAVAVALIGAAINFNTRLIAFFAPHASQPAVEFIINFLFVWLVAMLALSYARWREAALRSQELEDIIDAINPDVLLVVDTDRMVLMSNKTMGRMFGYTVDDVIGQRTDLLYSDRRQMPGHRHEIYDALEQEGFHVGAATGRTKDGRTFPLEIITGLLKRHGGSVLLLRDVSERQQAEELLSERESQLRQSQKMEALGLLAGGVAHDFNNLLTSILGFSSLAVEAIPIDHPARRDMLEVIAAAERAANLTAQLLALGRKQTMQVAPIELNAVVGGMAELLRRTLGEDVTLDLQLGSGTGYVLADKGGIEQIILNFAVNSRDAMPNGGRLEIKTGPVTLDAAYCQAHAGVKPGTYRRLLVRDTGSGMTKEVRDHAFEPFFTTKENGKGTGLGLSMVYGIVHQCEGYIELDSAPGQGTEFKVYFRQADGGQPAGQPCEKSPLPTGAETVLIVEDESAVRSLATRVLSGLGYRVREASCVREAIAYCRNLEEPLHLLLVYLGLPDGNGAELVAKVRDIRQDFRVLYATGFGTEQASLHGLREQDAMIPKPYSQESLARRVRQILDA